MRVGGWRVAAVLVISVGWCALQAAVPATAAGATEASPAVAATDPHDDLVAARQLAAQINAERATHGLPTLAIHGELATIAQAHSRRMAAAGRIWHNDDLFSDDVRARLGAKALGENVGADGRDGEVALHQMYMDSAPHRANILDPRFTAMGIGVAVVDGVAYSTEDFMQAAPPPPPPPPTPAPAPAAPPTSAPPPGAVVRAESSTEPVTGAPETTAPPTTTTVAPRPRAATPAPDAALTAAGRPVVDATTRTTVPAPFAGALGVSNGLLLLAGIGVRRRAHHVTRPIAEVADG